MTLTRLSQFIARLKAEIGYYRQKFGEVWSAPAEPMQPIEMERNLRILRGLVSIFSVLATLVLIIQAVFIPSNTLSTIIIIVAGLGVVLIIYVLSRLKYYYPTLIATFGLGYVIILTNAAFAAPPHLEILYIVLVPLLATALFTFREAVIINITAFVMVLGFLAYMKDIPQELLYDIPIFLMFTQVFILFVSYERNRLEQDRRKLAVEHKQVEVLKQFLSNVSHDLKTPLTVITTSLYLLRREVQDARGLERIERIEYQTRRLDKLIQDILTMSRLDQTDEPHNREWLNLNEIVLNVINELSSSVEARQIALSHDLDDKLIPLHASWDNIHSMLTNLIENAVNYTPLDGQIFIQTRQDESAITITVQDTGFGISAEDLPRIFERFYRADKARSTHTGGTGLGLAIVQRTVEMYEGQITVESVVNEGTTFTITLPLTQNPAKPMPGLP